MELHEKIRFFRKKRKLSQKELADLVFVSHNALSQYETGERKLPTELFEKFANALELKVWILEDLDVGAHFRTKEEKYELLKEFIPAYQKVRVIMDDFEYGEERELEEIRNLLWNATFSEEKETKIIFPSWLDSDNVDCVLNCLEQFVSFSSKNEHLFTEAHSLLQDNLYRTPRNFTQNRLEKENKLEEEIADFVYWMDGIKTDSAVYVYQHPFTKEVFVQCEIPSKYQQYKQIIENIEKEMRDRFPHLENKKIYIG